LNSRKGGVMQRKELFSFLLQGVFLVAWMPIVWLLVSALLGPLLSLAVAQVWLQQLLLVALSAGLSLFMLGQVRRLGALFSRSLE